MTVQKMIEAAKAEVGYREKNSDANLDSKTAVNDGNGNHTKYARDLHNAGFFNGDKCGYAWCAVFVTWLMWSICGKDKKETLRRLCQSRDLGAGCRYAAEDYQKAGRWTSTPVAGAQIFFAAKKGDYDHTGLVTGVDDKWVYTIEGNSHNRVEEMQYLRSDPAIQGYGLPIYEEEATLDAEPPKDEPSGWAKTAAEWAVARGLVRGDGNSFGWKEPVTLERLVTLLYRYDQEFGKPLREG